MLCHRMTINEEQTTLSGSEVGLAAVKATTEAMGGTIDIETEVGKGTSFIMNLPLITL